MKQDWDKAIEFVFQFEGGYVFDPNDPGGETKYGISHKSYPKLDIKNLTIEHAQEIYRRDYWQSCKCDELSSPMSIVVFDTAVNQGVHLAKRLLQISLGVAVDGVIGDKTIAASHKSGREQIKLFLSERLAAYARLMASNTVLLNYARGWSHRVISLAELVFENEGERPIT